MQVLVADDDAFTRNVLQHTLKRMGYEVCTARDGKEALAVLRRGGVQLVITDWDMPTMTGIDLCRAIRREELGGYVYIIMLTARDGARSRLLGLNAGADDFLRKPLDPDELLVCLKTADRILSLETRDVALFALAKLAESRDPETGAHIDRVQSYTRLIAIHLSEETKIRHGADDQYVRLIYQTSPLHDLGKVGIPDSILLKPGRLTAPEYEVMKTHAAMGAQTLDAALQRFPRAGFLQMARDIAATHHERFDGAGYPRGLSGEQIPLCGRIVALADVYDALTSRRVYKDAIPHSEARRLIIEERGRQFDPDVVDAFLHAEEEIINVSQALREETAPIVRLAVPIATETSGEVTGGPVKILVVEDDPAVRGNLLALLSKKSDLVYPAASLSEAMNLFSEQSPQMIISDCEMPGGSGIELCQMIRRQPGSAAAYFIMLTAHTDQDSLLSAYNAGVNDFVGKPYNTQELLARMESGLRLIRAHNALADETAGLRAMNGQLSAMNSRLDRLSITDELTGLYNRRHAIARLEEQWALTDRYTRPLTVAMVDIDHFKRINDVYGHETGDLVLRSVANLLRDKTRTGDVVCRIGGEEFLIIFPSQTTAEATICVERFRQAVADHRHIVDNREIPVTVSVGVASRDKSTEQFPDLLKLADQALYAAKHGGRNCVRSGHDAALSVATACEKTPSVGTSAPAAVQPIDVVKVRQRCGGDENFTAAVLERFRNQAGQELKRMIKAMNDQDKETLCRSSHNMKSMSAYVAADRASQLSEQIEQLAKAGELNLLGDLMGQLQTDIEGVVAWLNQSAGERVDVGTAAS